MTNVQFPHPSKFSVLITKQRLIISMNARNSVTWISKNERNSCSRFCFNCANSYKHIGKNCDQGPPHCKICGNRHATVLHDPSRSEDKVTSTSLACTQVCKEGPIRWCARIVLLKVSGQSDPSKETLTFAVLDDQSTDVLETDNLLNELSIYGK